MEVLSFHSNLFSQIYMSLEYRENKSLANLNKLQYMGALKYSYTVKYGTFIG